MGFLAGDAAAWEGALLTLAAEPGLRGRLGTAGRARVVDRYSQRAYTGKYRALLQRVGGGVGRML